MRGKKALAVAVSFMAAVAVLAQASGEAKKKSASKAGGDTPIFKQAGDLKWTDLDPTGAPGVKIADLWGDHTKGAYGAFIKFPPGFSAPLHTHTYAAKLVIVSGTLIAGPEGKPEVRLGPGSYYFQPGRTYRHTTACDKASECLFFSEGTGKFDLIPADGGKAPAKK